MIVRLAQLIGLHSFARPSEINLRHKLEQSLDWSFWRHRDPKFTSMTSGMKRYLARAVISATPPTPGSAASAAFRSEPRRLIGRPPNPSKYFARRAVVVMQLRPNSAVAAEHRSSRKPETVNRDK